MTRHSKCEICRERKVKCDEQRPTCSACSKKGRPCYYKTKKSDTNTSIGEQTLFSNSDQTLALPSASTARLSTPASPAKEHESGPVDAKSWRLKYAHLTSDSRGMFLTFRQSENVQLKGRRSATHTQRTASPKAAILCRTTALTARWSSVFGYESMNLNPLGEWVRMALSTTDESSAINLACEYTLSSMMAFQLRNKAALIRAHAVGSKAIKSLQTAVINCSGRENIHNLILAVLLHCAAEHFLRLGSFNYVPHFLGAAELLKMYQKMEGHEALLQATAKASCMDEALEAILDGRESSAFQDTFRPPTGSCFGTEASHDVQVSFQAVHYIISQLPQLVFQARVAMQRDAEIASDTDLVERIAALFNHDANLYVERMISAHSKVFDDPQGLEASPLGKSSDFTSVDVFFVATRYYWSQVILCGLIQRLCEHVRGIMNVPAATARDIAAASSLVMCVDYALKPTPARPFTALAILAPIQLSLGSWIRHQRRQTSTHTLEYMHAERMLEWSLEKAHYIEDMWQSAPATIERMTLISDMFAGGPFVPARGLQRESQI